jgi:hypothetical protein
MFVIFDSFADMLRTFTVAAIKWGHNRLMRIDNWELDNSILLLKKIGVSEL